jgi:hypothetical protein
VVVLVEGWGGGGGAGAGAAAAGEGAACLGVMCGWMCGWVVVEEEEEGMFFCG